jgi:MerR family transcriptional regulator, repressor of the yfmOP operon
MARITGVSDVEDASGAPATTPESAPGHGPDPGLRISEAASRVGVSARTLRYYDELGLLSPSLYTAGGERRYRDSDLLQLQRILELREALGMNLEEIKGFLESEQRLDEVRAAYRAEQEIDTVAARRQRRALLEEALVLNESLKEQLNAKLARMDAFRATLARNADRCRELLAELE